MSSLVFLECKCTETKKHHLIFDGGSSGQYTVDVCDRCYQNEDRKFLIKEEQVTSLDISPPEEKN